MTPNRSLNISMHLQQFVESDFASGIKEIFPFKMIDDQGAEPKNRVERDRVFNAQNTLFAMTLSSLSADKSLQEAVNMFRPFFEARSRRMREAELQELRKEKEAQEQTLQSGERRKRGRPKLHKSTLAKSKHVPISTNTAAYAKARKRLNPELVEQLFKYTADYTALEVRRWHGMVVSMTDGTYLQLQDTPDLKGRYKVAQESDSYPQALLQTLVIQGTGQVYDFKIGTRKQSELELVKPMIEKLPPEFVVLADDLYNCYGIFCLFFNQRANLIVPGKRDRKYKVVKSLGHGDEIVELQKPQRKSPWLSDDQWSALPQKLLMRRISIPCVHDEQKQCVIYSTLLDPQITATEIVLKYYTRWDIEITIREIKTLMGLNIARSKTEDMVFKEITVALAAYNMMRKIIAESVENTDFSPQSDFLQKSFEPHEGLLVDRKGRVYHRWSPGRPPKAKTANQPAKDTATT